MLPREHGAYGQVLFPLVTSLAVVGLSPGPALIAVAVVALFLAHEPLVILLGHRGRPALAALGAKAWVSLHVTLVVATAAGILALDRTPAQWRWTFVIPVAAAAALFAATIRNREKSTFGETVTALAAAAAAIPLCASGGRPIAGSAIALAFALLFVVSTLAVRVIILRTRGGGNLRAAHVTQQAAFIVAATGAVIAVLAAFSGTLRVAELAASAPGVAFAAGLAMYPPAATRLKRVGWTLIAMAALTSVLLIVAS